MTRSKRFRKRQTQRKTKRIIVGGGKTGNVSRAKKPRTARTARRFPNIEAVLRAAFHPVLNRRAAPPQLVNVLAAPRRTADPALYLTPFVHNPFVPNPSVPNPPVAPSDSVVYRNHFEAPSAGVAPTSSVANTTRSAASYMHPFAAPFDSVVYRHPYPVVAPAALVAPALNRRSAPPPHDNVLADLTENTAKILAELKSSAAPPANALPLPFSGAPSPSALPPPPSRWFRKRK